MEKTFPGNRLGDYTAGSLQNRIRQFYLANRTEELTYADMAAKFDCTVKQAQDTVKELKRNGFRLESVMVIRVAETAAA